MRETLQEKLNKEYELIGVITIKEMHEDVIDISKIKYVSGIIDKVEPLEIQDKIILAKDWFGEYNIIDGYHRMKSKILKGETRIEAIILDDFRIERKVDSLYDFMKKLVGKNIKFIEDNILYVNDSMYEIEENEGCGGCGNGWSSIEVVKDFIGKEIKVKTIEQSNNDDHNDDIYNLMINGKLVAKVDTGWGNGYYGGDFEVRIRN